MLAAIPLWIGRVVRWLPSPLRAALDGWSHQVAQRHARQRRDAWSRRQAAAGQRR